MATLEIRTPPLNKSLFHVAYASKAKTRLGRSGVTKLADHAAEANAPRGVSGVLIEDSGRFLQWLEGPLHQVCGVMARITNDPRHTDITVLAADWAAGRRFSRWPMQLANAPEMLGHIEDGGDQAHLDPRWAEAVFAGLADDHHRQVGHDAGRRAAIAAFAQALIKGEVDAALSEFPELATPCLHARAAIIDDVCAAFRQGWREDQIDQGDIVVGLTNLTLFWRLHCHVPDPLLPRRHAAVVTPPGSWELIGSIVKTDLLRADGVAVDLVVENTDQAALEALDKTQAKEIIVAGPRVGLCGDEARAVAFAEMVRDRLPETPVHMGGRASGPLNDWSHRIVRRPSLLLDQPDAAVEWLALSALGELAHDRAGGLHH